MIFSGLGGRCIMENPESKKSCVIVPLSKFFLAGVQILFSLALANGMQ
jgi:hypothetical protein